MLKFDPNYGLLCENTEDIRTQVQNIFKNAFGDDLDVDPETPQGQIIDSLTAIIADKDTQLLELSNQFDPYKNDGIYQEALAHLYFIERKGARASLVTCECKGLSGTFIPRRSIVKNADNILFYSLDDAYIGETGKVDIVFECEKVGAVYTPLHSVNTIVTVISGFDSVINNSPVVLGSEEESRAEFEKRRSLSVAKNAQGSISSLYGELSQIENVVDLLILENTTSVTKTIKNVEVEGHSILISIAGGNDVEIATAIYRKKDAGCGTSGTQVVEYVDSAFGAVYKYNIVRPKSVNIFMQVHITIKEDTKADIEETIKQILVEDFYGRLINTQGYTTHERVHIGADILASRFYLALLNAGISELTKIELSFDNSNFYDSLSINADNIPALSAENIHFRTFIP